MPFATHTFARSKHVATRVLRAGAIIALVLLAVPLMFAFWFFWAAVYTCATLSVLTSGPRTLFRYEENSHAHGEPHRPEETPAEELPRAEGNPAE
jgi:hypothetical protein